MLVELSIQNIAIIDRLRIAFEPGMNALTGETGAGKSIIIDALGAVIGGRTSPDMLRSGEERARIEAVFDLSSRAEDAALTALLDEAGIEHDDATLILSRDLHANGRSVARINGQTVTVNLLGRIGERLVDIHGQSAHLSLLRPATHLDFLDAYAGVLDRRAEIASLVAQVRRIRAQRAELERDDRELARRTDLLRFQVDEIEGANLAPDEEEALRVERQRLGNAASLQVIADTVYRTLREGAPPRGTSVVEGLRDVARNLGELARLDPTLAEAESEVDEIEGANLAPDEEEALRVERQRLGNAASLQVIADTVYRTLREGAPPRGTSVVEGLRDVARNLGELARLDPALAEAESEVDEMVYLLEDVAATVRTYRDTVEDNPARLAEVEERLVLIRDLERKYGGTVEEVLRFGEEAARELAMIEGSEERLLQLRDEESRLLRQIGERASKLSQLRHKAANRLAKAIEQQIAHLAMGRTRFTVYQSQEEDPEGAPVPGEDGATRTLAFDARGVDRVEFLIAPNVGEAPKPLARIASGGETARLMLALKSVLATADTTPTLVFDEVDVGIGGRSGHVVGETLSGLARNHQVLCITHLAQVAAFADGHFRIIKRDVRGRTISDVERLDDGERVDELAAMLDGVPITPAARASAQDLAERAAAEKASTDPARAPAAD